MMFTSCNGSAIQAPAFIRTQICPCCEQNEAKHKVSGWTEISIDNLQWVDNEPMCAGCIHDYMLRTQLTIDGVKQDELEACALAFGWCK